MSIRSYNHVTWTINKHFQDQLQVHAKNNITVGHQFHLKAFVVVEGHKTIYQQTICYTLQPLLIVEENPWKEQLTHQKLLACFLTYPLWPNLRLEPKQTLTDTFARLFQQASFPLEEEDEEDEEEQHFPKLADLLQVKMKLLEDKMYQAFST